MVILSPVCVSLWLGVGAVIFCINPVIAPRTPAQQGGAAAAQAGAEMPGRELSPGPCPLPGPTAAIPQAAAAISCPGRECAGPGMSRAGYEPGRECAGRAAAERGARAVADAPGLLPPIHPAAARAPPTAGPPPRGTPGRESGAAPRVPHGQRSLPPRWAPGAHPAREK